MKVTGSEVYHIPGWWNNYQVNILNLRSRKKSRQVGAYSQPTKQDGNVFSLKWNPLSDHSLKRWIYLFFFLIYIVYLVLSLFRLKGMYSSFEGKEKISSWSSESCNLLDGRDPGTLTIDLQKDSQFCSTFLNVCNSIFKYFNNARCTKLTFSSHFKIKFILLLWTLFFL